MRVLIYPYIPDLNKDGLKSLRHYIKKRFEEKYRHITVQVDGDPNLTDPYKLDNLRTYLGSGASAYDLAEVDTILLGELVRSNLIQPDPNPDVPVNDTSFLRSAVDAVKYNGHQYGIPTLVCANFLAEITSLKGTQDAVNLIGSFRGSWSLSGHYLNAFINKYGAYAIDEGVLSNPSEQRDILLNIKHFSDSCVRKNGNNPCIDNTYKDNTDAQINDVIASKRSSFLAYAEVIGQALFTDAGLVIQSVRAPPFGGAGHLQMYTDALVANRNTYGAKKDAIKKFITFYTSINFRFEYAYCGDMDFKCIRYVLPATSGFYSLEKVEQNCLYSQLRDVFMTSGTAGPNHEIYYKKDYLDASVSKELKYPPLSLRGEI